MKVPSRYSLKERFNLEEIYDRVMGLTPREQLIAAGVAAFVLLLLIVLPISCASSKLGKLDTQILNYEKDVSKIIAKIEILKKDEERLHVLQQKIRPKFEVKLTTRLESLATQIGIGNNIDSLQEKPGASGDNFEELTANVKISKLSLNQLIEFLHGIETQSDLNLRVDGLQMKPRYDNRQLFDANFDVVTLVSVE